MIASPIAPHHTLIDGSYADCAAAIVASNDRLTAAASAAIELLALAGVSGMRGDTADDLRLAVALHGHLVHQFNVKVRTSDGVDAFDTHATSAASAYQIAADKHGDAPCGITVILAEPDQHSLSAAHRALKIGGTLDHALKNRALSVALHSYARKHPRRAAATDFKQLAANDRD